MLRASTRAVAGAPDAAEALDREALVDPDPTTVVGRQIEVVDGGMGATPAHPQHWVERACFVGRDLSPEEWERHVPGDETPRSACP